MMIKLLSNAFATAVFRFRRIVRRLEKDLTFRVLAAGNVPAQRTICELRLLQLKQCRDLFVTGVSAGA
jgi:hypothetical protein